MLRLVRVGGNGGNLQLNLPSKLRVVMEGGNDEMGELKLILRSVKKASCLMAECKDRNMLLTMIPKKEEDGHNKKGYQVVAMRKVNEVVPKYNYSF